MSVYRIGLIVPSSNTTMEVELYRMAPQDITIHTDRMFLTKVSYKEWQRMNKDIIRCCKYLATAKVDIIIFGCTGASFSEGAGYDKQIEKLITDTVDLPAITTATALLEGIRAVKATRIALATPYPLDVHQRAERFLMENGIVVESSFYMNYVRNTEIGSLDPKSAVNAARRVNCQEAEAVVLSCTNWRTIEVLAAIEDELGKPVITSNQASFWAALKKLKYTNPIVGWGKLMNLR